MIASTTTIGYTTLSRRNSGNDNLAAAFLSGALFLLAGTTGASATGSVITPQQPRVHMFATSSRETALRAEARTTISQPASQDTIVTELSRLTDGWAGQGTRAPTTSIIDDVDLVISVLNINPDNIPEVQIDDDGATTLLWTDLDGSLLTLEFFGKGYVACTFSHAEIEKCRFKKILTKDEIGIANFLDQISENGGNFKLV
jgi:hypothetical protein